MTVLQGGIHAQEESVPQRAFIGGTILQADSNKTLSFDFFENYLSFEEINYPVQLKRDSFFIEIPLKENMPGFLSYGEVRIPVFLELGDSLFITAKENAFTQSLVYSGKGGLANDYLKSTFLHFDLKDPERIEAGIAQNTAEGFGELMDQLKQEKVHFLDSFLTKRDTHFTKTFDEYVKADINYWWGYNLMRYQHEHPASHILPVTLTLPDQYFEFIDTLELNNERVLNNLNYLYYLDHYTKWRQERLEKGLLKIKTVHKTTKKPIKINMVETFGQVLMDGLKVRAKAHDEHAVIAVLNRGEEVLYLQDMTSDRFSYSYNGHQYLDRFLKIELPDGRSGWVFRGGVYLKEKIVQVNKWVIVPDASPEILNKFKYAAFKGRVLYYALAKDLYWDIINDKVLKEDLEAYLKFVPDEKYKELVKKAYSKIRTDTTVLITSSPLKSTTPSEVDSANVKKLLAEIASLAKRSEKNLLSDEERVEKDKFQVHTTRSTRLKAKPLIVNKPDFSLFSKVTSLKGMTASTSTAQMELIVNTNPLLRESSSYPFPDQENAHFHFDIALQSATTAAIKVRKERIDLYVQPGDKMDVTINGEDIYKDILFSGKGSKANNYLVAAARQFHEKDLELAANLRYAQPAAFKSFVNNLRMERLNFLRTYLQSHQLNSEFIKYAKADINYWYAFNLMNYPYEHPIFHDQPVPMEVPGDYYDFMEEIPINNKSALPNKYYIYYLQDFLSFQSKKIENIGLSRLELADKYLRGQPLYFYKALQYALDCRRVNGIGMEESVLNFIENCPYKLYDEYLKLAYHESKGILEGMDAPTFNLKDINGRSVSLIDFKGKVVFLDFWATWCTPCIHQLPSHKKLQEQFQGREVVFLYISMDRNSTIWKNFVQNNNLPGIHLSAGTNMLHSQIAKKYKVNSLPYSLIIDPNGKIAWHHIGGYSVQKVGALIAGLL